MLSEWGAHLPVSPGRHWSLASRFSSWSLPQSAARAGRMLAHIRLRCVSHKTREVQPASLRRLEGDLNQEEG
eukprot:5865932-Pyramimonas_sp.AAC.1